MLPKQGAHHQKLRRIVLALGLVLAALAVSSYFVDGKFIRGLSQYMQPRNETTTRRTQRRRVDSCEALRRHEEGHWEHLYAPQLQNQTAILNASSVRDRYLPVEIGWLAGKNVPARWKPCFKHDANYNYDGDDAVMYKSQLGNQCGQCGVEGFAPSLSSWVADENVGADDKVLYGPASPALRLVQRLAEAKKTLCWMGDSVDKQFFDALRHNLFRQRHFQDRFNITVGNHRKIPVNYTNETGAPPYVSWMTMQEVLETTISLEDREADPGAVHSTTIRYFQMYGWSPWNAQFVEGQCDVLIANLGLHYDASGEMRGTHWGRPKFWDDFRAAVAFLAEFEASGKSRVSVWRSTLPQHFNSSDGHWNRGQKDTCSLNYSRVPGNYNNATERAFAEVCEPQRQTCSGRYEHTCTVNRTSVEYRTVYKYYLDNNCTERLKRFEGRTNATGTILRWKVADLFDQPQWHHGDCSHFCFVPPLYEAAFHRLHLLLPSFD